MFRQLLSSQSIKNFLASHNISTHHASLILRFTNRWMPKRYLRKNADRDNPHQCRYALFAALGVVGPGVDTNFNMGQPDRPPTVNSQYFASQSPSSIYINWNQFCYQMLAKGEVEKIIVYPHIDVVKVILYDGAIINGVRAPMKQYILQVSNIDSFERRLRDFEQSIGIHPGNEVPLIYERTSSVAQSLVGAAMILGLIYFAATQIAKTNPKSFFSSITKARFTLVDPASKVGGIKFQDVAGLKEAKIEIMEFVEYLKNSERFLKLGAKLPKGMLLTGPPGCGKTLLAKAVATEAGVPFLALSGSDFVEMIGGVGASRVRSLFKKANKLAPCIVYIDEIDSIGKKRSSSQFYNGEMEQTLNQLLVEMDGMVPRKGVILLASTNRAEVLDQALLRPGRFDRQILIDLPTLEERRQIFERYASKIKLDSPPNEHAGRIAQLTPGMSGADLANVCNEAALHAARKDRSFVTQEDLEYAIERVVGGTEKRASSLTAEEKRMIAYHESGHALVGWLLEHTEPILKVSIVPRTTNILGYAQYLPSDQKLYNPDQFFDRMCMALGGRAPELLKFNHLSTGAQDDLKRVTDMAMAQIKEYGFDPVVGHISFPKESSDDMGKRPYSKRLASIIDHRAGVMVREAFDKTHKLLNENMEKLNLLAEALLAREVLNTEDIEKLIGPPPFKKSLSR